MTGLFYVFGLALTVLAIVVSFLGLRSERFPKSRAAYAGLLGAMSVLVVASCGFAVALSAEEQEVRSEEIAEFRAEEAADAEEIDAEGPPDEAPSVEEPQNPEPKPEDALALTSPEDGSLVFEPISLTAPPGEVAIDYTNPSEVPHNVAIEADGETVAQGATVTGGKTGEAAAQLEAGSYAFFCSIPGHRESGMEGVLDVE